MSTYTVQVRYFELLDAFVLLFALGLLVCGFLSTTEVPLTSTVRLVVNDHNTVKFLFAPVIIHFAYFLLFKFKQLTITPEGLILKPIAHVGFSRKFDRTALEQMTLKHKAYGSEFAGRISLVVNDKRYQLLLRNFWSSDSIDWENFQKDLKENGYQFTYDQKNS